MSFRLKTILGIASIEITLLAILVFSGLTYLRQLSEAELLTRGSVTAQLFATMTSDSVLSVDLATLDSLVQQTLMNDGIEYVRVRSPNGTILSAGGEPDALAAPFDEDTSVAEASTDGRLDVSAPIVMAGENFGQVEIGLSTDRLEQAIGEARQWMLTIAASEIVIVAVFGIALGTILTRQLARLREAARRVSAGEFGHQITVQGKDELADTTHSFNRMSSALAAFAREAEAAQARAEAGRAYAETVLNDAMNSMPQSVLIVSSDDNVTFVNDSFMQRHADVDSIAVNEGAFANIAAMSLPETITIDGNKAPLSVEDRLGRLREAEKYTSWRATMADGTVLMTTQERMSDGGVVVVEHDVTELFDALERNRQLEMELMQTQKLESLGTMAGGIAHEINTPVQFVGDNLKFLEEAFIDVQAAVDGLSAGDGEIAVQTRTKLEELDWSFVSEEIPGALSEARDGIKTVGEIVKSIKEFAHPDSDIKSAQNLEKVINNTLTVSRNQWRDHSEIECIVHEGLDAVPCFSGKLSQVLINLIVNAADAIEESGKRGLIKIEAMRIDGFAQISISDNGPGIPADKIDNIFDMFFTTKAPGKGTGQGLAICKRIIETNHGGMINVQSNEGEGATFIIMLPISDTAIAA